MSDERIVKAVKAREQGEGLLKKQGLLTYQADKRAAMKRAPDTVKERGVESTASTRKPTAGDEEEDEEDDGLGLDLDL